jgi:protease I
MAGRLDGHRIAILVTDGFEQVEMTEPKNALESEGAETIIIAPKRGAVKGWKHNDWGDTFDVDVALHDAEADDYDALLLPGGVMCPDKLRVLPEVQTFVREFFVAAKPVAAICHAPWTLIDAGVANGRTLTSWPTIRSDLHNAGANVVDEEAVVDGNLLTSRSPRDIPAFNAKMIELVAAGPRDLEPLENRAALSRPHALRGD